MEKATNKNSQWKQQKDKSTNVENFFFGDPNHMKNQCNNYHA